MYTVICRVKLQIEKMSSRKGSVFVRLGESAVNHWTVHSILLVYWLYTINIGFPGLAMCSVYYYILRTVKLHKKIPRSEIFLQPRPT